MNIFSKTKVQEVAVVTSTSLKQKSVNALDTFQKVLQDLKSINDISSARQADLKKKKKRIELEIQELASISASNNKVIKNIEAIIS